MLDKRCNLKKMEEIKVVQTQEAKEFENQVNYWLKNDWSLHGEPQYRKVSCQDTWAGRQRAWTEQSFVQILKRNRTENT